MYNRGIGWTLSLFIGLLGIANPLYAEMLGVGNQGAGLVSIDLTTGATTSIGGLPEDMTEAVFDSASGRLYAQGSNGSFTLYDIDPVTGGQNSVVSTSGAHNGLEYVGGTLYTAYITGGGGSSPSTLATLDPTTGVSTDIGLTGYAGITGLAYDVGSATMYGMVGGADTDLSAGSLVTINLGNGVATIVGPTGFERVGSIEFGSDGQLYGSTTGNDPVQANQLIRINTATGAASVVGDLGVSVAGLAETNANVGIPTPVPTLSQWALFILAISLGLLGIAGHQRRPA